MYEFSRPGRDYGILGLKDEIRLGLWVGSVRWSRLIEVCDTIISLGRMGTKMLTSYPPQIPDEKTTAGLGIHHRQEYLLIG